MRVLAVLLVGVAACGGSRAPAAREVMTGDPLPATPVASAACDDGAGYRWLGSDPHVPLATSGADGIASAEACCAAWGQTGDAWTALDAWGAPIATRTVTGGEGYDVTQCYELTLDGDAEPAAALLVRGDQPWSAPASAQWIPDDAERASLLALAATLEVAFTAPAHGGPRDDATRALPERVTFFAMPGDDRDPGATTRFAAIGGRALVIAGLDTTGTWRIHHLDASWGLAAGPWLAEPYRILAVVDVDRDGYPEVIVHRSDGPSWDDAILECAHDSTLRLWDVVAESVGGSTA